ncbi:MAG: pacearchaeosortase [Candidatus Pacearchaeota archaeon]
MRQANLIGMFARYIFLVLIALPGMRFFYLVFTPLTIYPSFWLLSLFYSSTILFEDAFIINSSIIQIIPACIAGAAYYLLLILNFATPMPPKTRINSIIFLIFSFLVFNIIRLVAFSILFINGYEYFGILHKMMWYFGSTLLVVLLWFANVYFFKIKAIPAYTDLKYLYLSIKKP